MAKVTKFLTHEEKGIRAAAITCADLIDEICVSTRVSALGAMGLGRATIGTILMASQLKAQHKIGLRFRGNGPLQEIYTEATFDGLVRGYVGDPQASLPLVNGRLDVANGVGIGLLDVITSVSGQNNPQVSTVVLQTGEIGDDIAYYLQQSQQTNCVVSLGIHLNEYGRVMAAGGIIIELMQSIDEKWVDHLEKSIRKAPPLSTTLLEGGTAEDMARLYLDGFTLTTLSHPYDFHFSCLCSLDRVHRSLAMIGKNELATFIAEGQRKTVTCEFCGKEYHVSVNDMQKILTNIDQKNQSLN